LRIVSKRTIAATITQVFPNAIIEVGRFRTTSFQKAGREANVEEAGIFKNVQLLCLGSLPASPCTYANITGTLDAALFASIRATFSAPPPLKEEMKIISINLIS